MITSYPHHTITPVRIKGFQSGEHIEMKFDGPTCPRRESRSLANAWKIE
jgi:hypothetical protein